LTILEQAGFDFRLNIIGQSYSDIPKAFLEIKNKFADKIANFGYLKSGHDYNQVLQESDIIVSTANHEFYGIGVVEAISAGVIPILPDRLAYPELLGGQSKLTTDICLYDGTAENLAEKIIAIGNIAHDNARGHKLRQSLASRAIKYSWTENISVMDQKLIDIKLNY